MSKEKIAILLPFKDHFTNSQAGSASIWVKDFNKKSEFIKNIYVCGNTDNLSDLIDKKNYINIKFTNLSYKSKNISYVDKFIKLNSIYNFGLVEVHNRPSYVNRLLNKKINAKIVLIFHNNPLTLGGSKSISERNLLIERCEKLVFVSSWVKEKFFIGKLCSPVSRFYRRFLQQDKYRKKI